jgi:hypothetical protein
MILSDHIFPDKAKQLNIFMLSQYWGLFNDAEYEVDMMSSWFNVETRDCSGGTQLDT